MAEESYETGPEKLIRLEKRINAPHVVILGAGATLAAFPTGDADGKKLPLMANIASVVGLSDELRSMGHDPGGNFETFFSHLYNSDPNSPAVSLIESRVEQYFRSLRLPDYPTLYDVLLLSLRDKDAIFTYNWDPFLVDTYLRYQRMGVSLPHIFHLHGNVRVGFCEACGTAGDNRTPCGKCAKRLTPTRLLYPVENKDYTKDRFIASQWAQARDWVKDALLLTIFGYSAPRTDTEAIAILTEAWKTHAGLVEQVEVIDIRTPSELGEQWGPFSHHGHYQIHRSILESRLALYPRRSCEALYSTHFEGNWTHEVPWGWNLIGLKPSIDELQRYERQSDQATTPPQQKDRSQQKPKSKSKRNRRRSRG